MNEIELGKRKIEYTLKISKRAKRLRLAVYCGGEFVVTTPQKINMNTIEEFILQKSKWVLDKIDYLSRFAKPQRKKSTKADFKKYKDKALKLVEEKIIKFNKHYNFKFNKITIRNQKTRWGSCSKRGNLNFNYKIALLPEHLVEYIVVHELCHLGEFNHSYKFWNLVQEAIPDYLKNRKELKKVFTTQKSLLNI